MLQCCTKVSDQINYRFSILYSKTNILKNFNQYWTYYNYTIRCNNVCYYFLFTNDICIKYLLYHIVHYYRNIK